MAMTETTRPDPAGTATDAPSLPDPRIFLTGESEEDRLVGHLAFALAAERGQAPTPETVAALRTEATADLSEFAFRYLHNRVEEIRREAVAAELARLGRPPGFGTMVLANLVALALAGGVAGWLAFHSETLAGLLGP